jgi:hypothetical protein
MGCRSLIDLLYLSPDFVWYPLSYGIKYLSVHSVIIEFRMFSRKVCYKMYTEHKRYEVKAISCPTETLN